MNRFPRFPLSAFIAALLIGLFGAWIISWHPFSAPEKALDPWLLELEVSSPQDGTIQADIDEGHGFSTDPSLVRVAKLAKGDAPDWLLVRKLDPARITAIQIIEHNSPDLVFKSARIRRLSGAVMAQFGVEDLQDLSNATVKLEYPILRLKAAKPAQGIKFIIHPAHPLTIPGEDEPGAFELVSEALGIAIAYLLLRVYAVQNWDGSLLGRIRFRGRRLTEIAARHPVASIAVTAALAVALNCYPVVFFGRSHVSATLGATLLYTTEPTLPGAPREAPELTQGSDIAAMMWAHMPYSVVESRAVLHDHELPLWNRYNSNGICLLGQGQSMMGDPLHWLPVLTGGAWWAWDLKFLLAKFLFAFALGLCVWALVEHLGAAILVAASALWIGYFAFRLNHAAIISVCYAPAILLAWLRLNKIDSWRAALPWGILLVVADMAEFNSGTMKESTMLMLWINFFGLLVVCLSQDPIRQRIFRAALGIWASILFFFLSAPFWLLFLDALRHTSNTYEDVAAQQLAPGLFIGFFDELFIQDFTSSENHLLPSVNFFMLIGVLWYAISWKAVWNGPAGRSLLIAGAVPLFLVFGIVPPSWIKVTPFLANVQHVHSTFGCILLILAVVAAGVGFRECLTMCSHSGWSAMWRGTVIVLAGMVLVYFGLTQALAPPGLLQPPHTIYLSSPFFKLYVPVIIVAAILIPWGLRWLQQSAAVRMDGLVCLLVCFVLLHFRHGMYVATKFDKYVMNPKLGMDLVAHSPAIDAIHQDMTEPKRVIGFGGNLIAGYSGVINLEGYCGPDALINRWYREFYKAAPIPVQDWMLFVQPQLMPQVKPICDFYNIGYYVQMPGQGAPSGLHQFASEDMDVAKSDQAWPRAFFTDSVSRYSTVAQFVKLIMEGDGKPFAATQDSSNNAPETPSPGRQIVPAKDYRLTNNTTAFSVEAPGPGYIVLGESFEDGNFKVTANGQPVECLRINHLYKGIQVDRAGSYRIHFSYRPKYLMPAFGIAVFGLLLAIGTLLLLRIGKFLPRWNTRNGEADFVDTP